MEKVFLCPLSIPKLMLGDDEVFDACAVEPHYPERTKQCDDDRFYVVFHVSIGSSVLPNDQAHLLGPLHELDVALNSNAAPVRCSAWLGVSGFIALGSPHCRSVVCRQWC